MAIINTLYDTHTVDPVSMASRAGQYDIFGNLFPLLPAPIGSYILPINITHTNTPIAGTVVWNMRNAINGINAPRIWSLRGIHVRISYAGTASAGIDLKYSIARFWSDGAFSGGNPLVAIKKRSSYTDPSGSETPTGLEASVIDTGLTTPNTLFLNTDSMLISLPASVTGRSRLKEILFDDQDFQLRPGEGLCIRLLNIARIGQSITGYITWDDRSF